MTSGEIPFIVLADGRTVMAHYQIKHTPQPAHSLSDETSATWELTLDGRPLTVQAERGWLPIDDKWANGDETPLRADAEGAVTYFYFYAHHLGWLSGNVTLRVDPAALTVLVDARLEFEAD